MASRSGTLRVGEDGNIELGGEEGRGDENEDVDENDLKYAGGNWSGTDTTNAGSEDSQQGSTVRGGVSRQRRETSKFFVFILRLTLTAFHRLISTLR